MALLSVSANQMVISTSGWGFQVFRVQSQRATPMPSRLQQRHPSVNRIPPLAVQANRRSSEVFLSTTTLGKKTTLTMTPSRSGATLTPATETATLMLTSSSTVSTLTTATLRTATLPTWTPSRLQGKLLAQRWPRSDQDSRSNQDASSITKPRRVRSRAGKAIQTTR